jgi:hypothetical protein
MSALSCLRELSLLPRFPTGLERKSSSRTVTGGVFHSFPSLKERRHKKALTLLSWLTSLLYQLEVSFFLRLISISRLHSTNCSACCDDVSLKTRSPATTVSQYYQPLVAITNSTSHRALNCIRTVQQTISFVDITSSAFQKFERKQKQKEKRSIICDLVLFCGKKTCSFTTSTVKHSTTGETVPSQLTQYLQISLLP